MPNTPISSVGSCLFSISILWHVSTERYPLSEVHACLKHTRTSFRPLVLFPPWLAVVFIIIVKCYVGIHSCTTHMWYALLCIITDHRVLTNFYCDIKLLSCFVLFNCTVSQSILFSKMHNGKLHSLYFAHNIVRMGSQGGWDWWECSTHGKMRNVYNIMASKEQTTWKTLA